MEVELVWNDDQDEPVTMNPSEIQVYWPQVQGQEPEYVLRVSIEDNELRVLVDSDHYEGTECVWSAVSAP